MRRRRGYNLTDEPNIKTSTLPSTSQTKEALEDTEDDDINHRSDVQTKTSLVCIC